MEVEAFELKLCSGRCWDSSNDVNLGVFIMLLSPGSDFKCINTMQKQRAHFIVASGTEAR